MKSLAHSRWECKNPGVCLPKSRRTASYGELRQLLGEVFHDLARQKECRIIEGHWIAIVGQIAETDNLSLATTADAYARVGLAVADAFIACWNTKYHYNLLRPVTYIRKLFDPTWSSFIGTPAFPEYTSGHSVQSGAAATVLTDLLGEKAFTDTTHVDHGLVPTLAPRSFTSFPEAADEAALSRLYGGIHFRPAIELGVQQGVCVGRTIIDRIKFKK
jgi:hypothetical protein